MVWDTPVSSSGQLPWLTDTANSLQAGLGVCPSKTRATCPLDPKPKEGHFPVLFLTDSISGGKHFFHSMNRPVSSQTAGVPWEQHTSKLAAPALLLLQLLSQNHLLSSLHTSSLDVPHTA